jgi:hypothetical protein
LGVEAAREQQPELTEGSLVAVYWYLAQLSKLMYVQCGLIGITTTRGTGVLTRQTQLFEIELTPIAVQVRVGQKLTDTDHDQQSLMYSITAGQVVEIVSQAKRCCEPKLCY